MFCLLGAWNGPPLHTLAQSLRPKVLRFSENRVPVWWWKVVGSLDWMESDPYSLETVPRHSLDKFILPGAPGSVIAPSSDATLWVQADVPLRQMCRAGHAPDLDCCKAILRSLGGPERSASPLSL